MRIKSLMLLFALSCCSPLFAIEDFVLLPIEPLVGSWTFSGMVTNEGGDRYGYFFQLHRQGVAFQVKTGLIDSQTNQLKFFYDAKESIDKSARLNWHVGRSFMRYNPINDSWVFGVKLANDQGFNFKVDLLKQASNDTETLILRPGVDLQAVQTSRLNGHIRIDSEVKDQFVTASNAWFGKVWFSKKQTTHHEVSTAFCRLSNDNGFYSANLKEADATGAAIAGWLDPAGNKVNMSQFISIINQPNNHCHLQVGVPKLKLNVMNTLKQAEHTAMVVAGFAAENKGFCFVAEETFRELG
jgi:hypothetical protein